MTRSHRVDPPTVVHGTLADWRRISLDKQLPQPGFFGSVRTPSLVWATSLLLLAIFCAFYMGNPTVYIGHSSGRSVSAAIAKSQEEMVASLARALAASATAGDDELQTAADRYAEDPRRDVGKLLAGLMASGAQQPSEADTGNDQGAAGIGRWRGVLVLDAATRQPVAQQGRPIDVQSVPAAPVKVVNAPVVSDDDPRLVVVVPLVDGRLLVGVQGVRMRSLRLSPDGRQTMLIAMGDQVAHAQGAALAPDDPAFPVVLSAVRVAERHGAGSSSGAPERTATAAAGQRQGSPASSPGAQVGPGVATGDGLPAGSDVAPLATAVRVGDLGFTVVSLIYAPIEGTRAPWRAVETAGAVLLSAGLALVVLRRAIVRPIRRLLHYARAVACGDLTVQRPEPRMAEARRIVAALTGLQAGERRRRRGSSGGGVPAGWVVVGVVAVVSGAVAVPVVISPTATELPVQIVRDSENRVADVAGRLDDTLEDGLDKLAALRDRLKGAGEAKLESALDGLVSQNPRFRSAYLTDAAGRHRTFGGREPLREAEPLPGVRGIRLHNISGPMPIVYAYVALGDGRGLVAEFDIRYLSGLLGRMEGRLRVADVDLHTILDTAGFRAFQPVSGAALQAAAGEGLAGTSWSGLPDVDGRRTLVVSAPLATGGATGALEWAVVAERPVSDFGLPDNELRRTAILVGILAMVIALLFGGWHYLLIVRPLRDLAGAADRLGAGVTKDPISPRRPDEIGALAVCIEVCRQAAVHGEERLGGGVRLRGASGPKTVVMPVVPPARGPAEARSRRVSAHSKNFRMRPGSTSSRPPTEARD